MRNPLVVLLLLLLLCGAAWLVMTGDGPAPISPEKPAPTITPAPVPPKPQSLPGQEIKPASRKEVPLPAPTGPPMPTSAPTLLTGHVLDGADNPQANKLVFLLHLDVDNPLEARHKAQSFHQMSLQVVKPFLLNGRPPTARDLVEKLGTDDLKAEVLKNGYVTPRVLARIPALINLGLFEKLLKKKSLGRSDKTGRYTFKDISIPAAGKGQLVLLATEITARMQPLPVVVLPQHLGADAGPDLVINRESGITGRMVGTGGSSYGYLVHAWRLNADFSKVVESKYCQASRQDGTFKLGSLRPGHWRLAAIARWRGGDFIWGPLVDLTEGKIQEGIEISKIGQSTLELGAIWENDEPINLPVKINLRLHRAAPPGEPGFAAIIPEKLANLVAVFTIPASGTKMIDGLSPGAFRLEARLSGVPRKAKVILQEPRTWEKKLPAEFRAEQLVNLKRQDVIKIRFKKKPFLVTLMMRVKDQFGQNLNGAQVHLSIANTLQKGTFRGLSAKTDHTGSGVISGIFPGSYKISARLEGYKYAIKPIEITKDGGGIQEGALVCERTTCIKITFLNHDGKPLTGHRVYTSRVAETKPGLSESNTFTIGSFPVNPKGVALLMGIKPGKHKIGIGPYKAPLIEKVVEVKEFEFLEITLKAKKPKD